jgi:S-DNA-T family DNA segregation ATPase FtsK/SpoIIIE
MDTLLIATVIAGGLALLRWRRPAWFWLCLGLPLAAARVLLRYGSVMEACGLTVPPSRMRLAVARATRTEVPSSRVPRIIRLTPTRTGLVLRIKMRPGQDAFDFIASSDRLRHSFKMQGVTGGGGEGRCGRAADDRVRRAQAGPDAHQDRDEDPPHPCLAP